MTARREWLDRDYYATLGVESSASAKDIKRAYRKLAQQYHPDTTSGDAAKEAKFKEINEAYSVLSDETTRAEYDKVRAMGPGAFAGAGAGPGGAQYVTVEDLGDLFGGMGGGGSFFGGLGDLFGRGAREPQTRAGRDVEAEVSLSFHEAVQGTTKTLQVHGGSPVQVKIPAGVNDRARIKVKGKGAPGLNGGPPGDLYVKVHAGSHPVFGRSGKDLKIDVPVTFTEAALGADIQVPTLDGSVTVRIPPGTPSGRTFKATGKGVKTDRGDGDLLVTVTVTVPKDLDDDQRTLLEQLRAQEGDANPRAPGSVSMEKDRTEAVYIISVAAELAGVHPQTLRIYERRGLIEPYRTPGGTRRYSDEDLEQLGLIQELTSDGVNLEGVRKILELRAEVERLEHQVSRLRRLLGESEQRNRTGTKTRTAYVKVTRNLPDVPRPDLLDE